MIKRLIVGMLMIGMLFVAGCSASPSSPSTEQVETQAVQQNMREMNNQVGMPFIQNFFEKKLAKQVFELRDQSDLITYAYMVNLDGRFVYLGKCLGFGLPYSVQYTNPIKYNDVYHPQGGSYGKFLPQADPNGLYMPEGLSATWLMLINEETGEAEIIYTEPSIIVTQSKLPKRLITEWSLPENY